MPTDLYWLVTAVRSLSATQASKQVTDTELAAWVNEGTARLYDELTLADDSYYSSEFDFSVSSGTEAAATAALPADFYRLRGVTRWPDTPRASSVYALSYDKRNGGEVGYFLSGDSITIVPWRLSGMAGSYSLHYVPVPPRFGRAIDISTASGDGVTGSVDAGWYFNFANGLFSLAEGFQSPTNTPAIELWNCLNANILPNSTTPPTPLGIPIVYDTNSNATSIAVYPAGTWYTRVVAETFNNETFAAVNGLGNITALDALMDPFRMYVVAYAAAKALAKKKQDTSDCVAIMGDELGRIKRAAPQRESEPEQAATLWRPRGRYYPGCF